MFMLKVLLSSEFWPLARGPSKPRRTRLCVARFEQLTIRFLFAAPRLIEVGSPLGMGLHFVRTLSF
jgi:hypothetical protein